ncbi:FCD domain-containing protein [Agrobacterium sp. ES01]|uniref:GntR family transcriptional regulator n=1 Tax=Agrobacterium sp. ES01 TaxID=3420714 RepID=UPI003D0F1BDF
MNRKDQDDIEAEEVDLRVADSSTPLQIDLMRQIIELIRDNGWSVGTRISVPDLARRFGVSRSPVTVALNLLKERGVVDSMPTPQRGMRVIADVSALDIGQIAPDSPHEELYRRIMSERARGELPQDVSEAELMPRYGISRGVVRKILMRFAAEGLAQRQPGHGWRFTDSLDNSDMLNESYEFRIAVECAGLRSPGFRVDLAQMSAIRRMHERILADTNAPTAEDWFKVNASFHEGLSAMSRNRFFHEAVRQQNNLRRMQEAASFADLTTERIAQSCKEHLAVLDAIEGGMIEWAEALLRQHLRKAADY